MADLEKLIRDIRSDALADTAPLSRALRKCVALGGDTGSAALRDWATQELKGYRGVDVPEYRRVAAPIQIDGSDPGNFVQQQTISVWQLPDVVQTSLPEAVPLTSGIAELEALVSRSKRTGDAVKIGLPGGAEIAQIMTAEAPYGTNINRVYWAVSPVAIEGVVDQVRTALIQLVAELSAARGAGETVAQAADNAVSLVVTGKRHTVNVINTQGSTHATVSAPLNDDESGWSRSRKIGAAVVGAFTVIGAVAAVLALLPH